MADINFASVFSHVRRPCIAMGKRDLPNHRMFFHRTRVESDKLHVISRCMQCTCLLNENDISVRAKMSRPSTIKGDVLTILSDAFCFFN